MPKPVEQEPIPTPPEGVVERAETPEVPEHIERGGVVKRPTNFTAQVHDDTGKPIIETPEAKVTEVVLPHREEVYEERAKGNLEDAITGDALYWLRRAAKAVHNGWKKVVRGQM